MPIGIRQTMDLINKLRRTTDNSTDSESTATSMRSHHEMATERIEDWGPEARTLVYCELCEQVFVSFDVFHDHRMASEYEEVRTGDPYPGYRELTAGDEFPGDATVGEVEPCVPTDEELVD